MKKDDLLAIGIDEQTSEKVLQLWNRVIKAYVPKEDIESLNNQMFEMSKSNAIDMAILKAGGKDPKEIKVNLDMNKIIVDKNGNIEGLDLQQLKKSKPYLFNIEQKKTEGTGITEGASMSGSEGIRKQFENAVYAKGGF